MVVGIIGATSQVGFSVALYLNKLHPVEVYCFVRSDYSKEVFELFELPVFIMDFNKNDVCVKLRECDIVIDFSYPSVDLFKIRDTLTNNISSIVSLMSPKSHYIYASSIMAFGNSDKGLLSNHFVPKSTYAMTKRFAEKQVLKIASSNDVYGVIFRLGQVHGFLQSISAMMSNDISNFDVIRVNGCKEDSVNIIFINSICESIFQYVNTRKKRHNYLIVSNPHWTLGELYEYYFNRNLNECYVDYKSSRVKKLNFNFIYTIVMKYRFIFENYILIHFPIMNLKQKGFFRVRNLVTKSNVRVNDCFHSHLLGQIKYNYLPCSSKDLTEVLRVEKLMESYYIETLRNFRK